MKIAICSIRYALLFGMLSTLMLAIGPVRSTSVITLFAVGELGATGFLCSLIVHQYRRRVMRASAMSAVAGYALSHIGVLAVMYVGFDGGATAGSAGAATLVWMELTLRVGLFVVLTSAAFVLSKPLIRKLSMPRFRKFTAAA